MFLVLVVFLVLLQVLVGPLTRTISGFPALILRQCERHGLVAGQRFPEFENQSREADVR